MLITLFFSNVGFTFESPTIEEWNVFNQKELIQLYSNITSYVSAYYDYKSFPFYVMSESSFYYSWKVLFSAVDRKHVSCLITICKCSLFLEFLLRVIRVSAKALISLNRAEFTTLKVYKFNSYNFRHQSMNRRLSLVYP